MLHFPQSLESSVCSWKPWGRPDRPSFLSFPVFPSFLFVLFFLLLRFIFSYALVSSFILFFHHSSNTSLSLSFILSFILFCFLSFFLPFFLHFSLVHFLALYFSVPHGTMLRLLWILKIEMKPLFIILQWFVRYILTHVKRCKTHLFSFLEHIKLTFLIYFLISSPTLTQRWKRKRKRFTTYHLFQNFIKQLWRGRWPQPFLWHV